MIWHNDGRYKQSFSGSVNMIAWTLRGMAPMAIGRAYFGRALGPFPSNLPDPLSPSQLRSKFLDWHQQLHFSRYPIDDDNTSQLTLLNLF